MKTSKVLSNHIRKLEERLLQPSVRMNPEEFLEPLADNFMEFGMSGNIWRKKDYRKGGSVFRWKIKEFRTLKLAPGIILATYRIYRFYPYPTRKKTDCSLRSSIWRLKKGRWRILFHQGTPTVKW